MERARLELLVCFVCHWEPIYFTSYFRWVVNATYVSGGRLGIGSSLLHSLLKGAGAYQVFDINGNVVAIAFLPTILRKGKCSLWKMGLRGGFVEHLGLTTKCDQNHIGDNYEFGRTFVQQTGLKAY